MTSGIFSQADAQYLAVEKLADGSTAIVDQRSKTVHSLNASAAIVWDACAQGATLPQIMAALEQRVGQPVDQEVALDAIAQLQGANLISSELPAGMLDQNRRSMLKAIGTFGAMALPVVLSLTASEQKAFAQGAGSRTTARPLG